MKREQPVRLKQSSNIVSQIGRLKNGNGENGPMCKQTKSV